MKTELQAARDATYEQALLIASEGELPPHQAVAMAVDIGFDAGWNARGSQWVAVSERLPEPIGNIWWDSLWAEPSGIVRKGTYVGTDLLHIDGLQVPLSHFVAWMPIPPYTADSGQDGNG